MLVRAAVLVGLWLAANSSPSRADCAAECTANYYNCVRSSNGADFCLNSQGTCLNRCTLERERHGAIAYSPRKEVYGYSHDFSSPNAAAEAALRNCRTQEKGTDDCRVLLTFHNACGALTLGDHGAYGSAWGLSQREAAAKALVECHPHGGSSCKIERQVCSETGR